MSRSFITFTILILYACALMAHAQQLNIQYTFEEFQKQFGRTYQGQQRQKHRKAFQKNYQKLLSLKKQYANDFKLRVNDKLDMTEEQQQNLFSYSPLKIQVPYDPTPKYNRLQSIALPSQLNYSALSKVTPVKNQGKCGACWAFTTAGILQSKMMILGAGQFDLSQQYILQCTPNSACNGGWPLMALNAVSQKGVPSQNQYPYKGDNKAFNADQICSEQILNKLSRQVDVVTHYNSVPERQLRQILIDHGPVSVGVKGSNNGFLFYGGGVFSGCDAITTEQQINHVVLLIGWTKEGNWIIKNSWGKSWGENGFGVIDGTRNCGITSFVDVLQLKQASSKQYNPNQDQIAPNQMQVFKVTLTDSFGDGWNGYIFGVRQNNRIMTVFGQEFKSGAQQGPIQIDIRSGQQVQIVVVVSGSNSQDIGFTITDREDKIVCKRDAGSKFMNDIIFCSFCPSCVVSNKVDYQLTLTDQGNNGWNGNVLAFNQDGVVTKFGEQFVSGQRYGPRKIEFTKSIPVRITVSQLGHRSQDIGFEIRDTFGNIIFSKKPGNALEVDTKIGQFCPACTNLFSVKTIKELVATDAQFKDLEGDQTGKISLWIFVPVVTVLAIALIGLLAFSMCSSPDVKKQIQNRQGYPHKLRMDSLGSSNSLGNIPCQSVLISTQTIPDQNSDTKSHNEIKVLN